jgi:hypothetical protein
MRAPDARRTLRAVKPSQAAETPVQIGFIKDGVVIYHGSCNVKRTVFLSRLWTPLTMVLFSMLEMMQHGLLMMSISPISILAGWLV